MLGKKLQIEYHPERPGDMRYFICDITAANKKFGFKPTIKPRKGVEMLLEWIEKNREVFNIKDK